jgi:hypothetical protein
MPLDPGSISGIVLAIPGIIDLCIKYAESIAEKIEAARNSDQQTSFRQLNIKGKLWDVKHHLHAFEKLTPDELVRFEFEIEELSLSVDSLKAKLQLMERRPSGWRWALIEKRRIDNLLRSVQEAHTSFHSKLTLVLVERSAFGVPETGINDFESFTPTPVADDGRYEISPASVFVDSIGRRHNHVLAPDIPTDIQKLLPAATPLPGSAVKTLPFPDGRGGFYIVEERGYRGLESDEQESTIARIRDVAATLHQSDPVRREWMSEHTGIAHCVGFASNDRTKTLQLLFNTSDRAKTINSLRGLLLRPSSGTPRPIYTLNEKIQLAQMVATAVLNTHNYRYVHKNIRPSNILCITDFKDGESRGSQSRSNTPLPSELGRALLVGYSDARLYDAGTRRMGPQQVGDEIYVHRSRGHQDATQNKKHSFLHDVYSLGVCLLEIGLWESLLLPASNSSDPWALNDKAFRFLKFEGGDKQEFLRKVQINFEETARYQLPRRMGQKYADVVVECLTGLEGKSGGDDRGFFGGDESGPLGEEGRSSDQDSVQLGFAYIDRVIRRLSNISI